MYIRKVKRPFILILLIFAWKLVSAQEISAGYFGLYAVQPGAKMALYVPVPGSDLFLSPQVAYFSRIDNHTNWLINLELGRKFTRVERKRYAAISGGVAYWRQTETVNVNTGPVSRENIIRHFLLPTINFEMGWQFSRIGCFIKNSVGSKIGSGQGNMALFLETGLKIQLAE